MRFALLVCLSCAIAHADAPRTVTGYRHGKPVRIQVVDVGWAEVEVKTARAFRAMQVAAAGAGVDLIVWSGFRSHERQAELYRRYRAREGNLAARPGFSNHQSGRALDLRVDDARTRTWLDRHARRYGFVRTVRSEPWHWEYVGAPRRARRAR